VTNAPPVPADPPGSAPQDLRRIRRGVLVTAVLLAGLYLVGLTGRWWPTNDSALYLGLGRSLAAGQGYRFNDAPCTSVAPGLPLALAGLFRIFGEGFRAPNVLMALSGLAAVAMVYLVIARTATPLTAWCVSACTGFSYLFYLNAHRVLTDAPFAALFWAALYAAMRFLRGRGSWAILAALLAGAGVLVRVPDMILLGLAAAGLLLDRPPPGGRLRSVAAAAALLLPAAALAAGLYVLARASAAETPPYVFYFLRYLRLEAGKKFLDFGVGLIRLPSVFIELLTGQKGVVLDQLGALGLLVAGIGLVRLWRGGHRTAGVLAAGYPLALLILASARSVHGRYLLPVQPVLLCALFEGTGAIAEWAARKRGSHRPTRAAAVSWCVLSAAILVCNAPRVLRNAFYYSHLGGGGEYYAVVRDGRYAELIDLAETARLNTPPAARVGLVGDKMQILHFISRRTVVPLEETARAEGWVPENLARQAASRRDLDLLVFDVSEAKPDWRNRLKAALNGKATLRQWPGGARYLVWQQAGPDAPATRRRQDR